jgi:hypothetical protein
MYTILRLILLLAQMHGKLSNQKDMQNSTADTPGYFTGEALRRSEFDRNVSSFKTPMNDSDLTLRDLLVCFRKS